MGRIIVVLPMLAFAVAGCFGGAASSHLSQSGISPEGGSGVRWTITYGVGQDQRERADVAACPSGATCKIVRDPDVTFSNGKHGWERIATRHLICPQATGDYVDPARACLALTRLRRILASPTKVACSCPVFLSIPGRAAAVINGRRVRVPLDFCTYCGQATKQTPADLATLQPQT